MTIAHSLVNVERIYAPFLKSEQNEFSEYVIKIFFYQKGPKNLFKTFWGVLMKYNPFYK